MRHRDTDQDWERLAQDNPYHAVLTSDKFKGDTPDDAALEEFFASGRTFVDNLVRLIKATVHREFAPRTALDFGCGVGRLLIPIAGHAERAVGLDVSETMLAEARTHIARLGADNAATHRANGLELPEGLPAGAGGEIDWINCYIVFQHIPPARGYEIFERMLDALAPGGVFSCHFTFARDRQHSMKLVKNARYARVDEGYVSTMRWRDDDAEFKMTMYDYDLNTLAMMLWERGCRDWRVRMTNHGGHYGAFLIGRLPAA